MCRICDNAYKFEPEVVLEMVGKAIEQGSSPEHFKKLLDKLLGTEEVSPDPERDEAWESGRRQ